MTPKLRLTGTSHPYPDDPSYLDAELAWLKVRVRRICAERKALEAQAEEEHEPDRLTRPGRVGSRDARLQAVGLREAEKKLRDEVDQRLQGNRSRADAPTLGLDVICKEFDLSSEERLILLVALPYGVSQALAEATLQDLSHHWGSISVADAIAVLDPKNVGDWLRYRALFRPHSPLVSHGLITLGKPGGEAQPSTLMCSDVSLSLDCFGRICGDPEMLTEGD